MNVGLWQPQRTVTPNAPTFADSGYRLGDRFQWRVRARLGTANPQPYSAPVAGTTNRPLGPGGILDGVREGSVPARSGRPADPYTSTAEEADFTDKLDTASDRMRVVKLADTRQNRPMNMFIFGYPTPPATAQAISDRPTVAINCNVHGNEASGRESCFTQARQLALSTDPAITGLLSRMTILMIPSINADGRAANTRGNTRARTSTAITP